MCRLVRLIGRRGRTQNLGSILKYRRMGLYPKKRERKRRGKKEKKEKKKKGTHVSKHTVDCGQRAREGGGGSTTYFPQMHC